MVPRIATAAQRFDTAKEDPESAPRSLPHSLSFNDRSYERFPLSPALAPGIRLNWDSTTRYSFVANTSPKKSTYTVPSRVSSSAMPRMLPLSPIRPQSSNWTHNDGPATGIQRDRALSSHLKVDSTQAISLPQPPARSRGFFDIVLAPPVHIPATKELNTTLTDLRAPSKPNSVTSHRAPAVGNASKKKKKVSKRKVPTPEPESSSSEDESIYDSEDESSDEDEPAPSRGAVKLMGHGSEINQPDIPISNVRDHCSLATCTGTRMQFDREYSRHKRTVRRAPLPTRARRAEARSSVPAAVRKSNRLAATRSATPASTSIDSATDISVSSVAGSSRAMSVASTTATAPRSKPKPKTARSKSVSRLSTSSSSSRDPSTPQPMSTSIAHSPDDLPPPAPTNVVSLRPGYNAYTPEDKQWFLDFVGWVFRQNVRAGKAEICQDIFQQAPHHRLESWKSYWRDHISQVEILRNLARERLPHSEPKRKPASRSSSTSTSSDARTAFDREANKASEGLWKLAELAELQGPVTNRNNSNKRAADDVAAQQRTKRSRY